MICKLINNFGSTKNNGNNKKLSIFSTDDIKNLKQENKTLRESVQKHVIENNEKKKLLQLEKQQNKNHKSQVCDTFPFLVTVYYFYFV